MKLNLKKAKDQVVSRDKTLQGKDSTLRHQKSTIGTLTASLKTKNDELESVKVKLKKAEDVKETYVDGNDTIKKLNDKIENQRKALARDVSRLELYNKTKAENEAKMKELEVLKLKLEQYMDDYDALKSEHDEKSILVETLLDSESTDVVDVRLVGQICDHNKEKCKKLQEANAKIDSLEKAVGEIKVK